MTFGEAVEVLRRGGRVTRPGWNGRGMWIGLREPVPGSDATLPYIFMKTADDHVVPWLASQTDVLALDWRVVEPAPAEV